MNSVAISGIFTITNGVSGLEQTWKSLFHPPKKCQGRDLNPKCLDYPFISSLQTRENSILDNINTAQYAIDRACKHANLSETERRTAGLIFGTTSAVAFHFISDYAELHQNKSPTHGEIQAYSTNNPGLYFANHYKLQGPILTLSNACTTGTDCLGVGYELIKSGQCKIIIACGCDILSLVPHTGFARLMITTEHTCMPFDRNRSGLLFSKKRNTRTNTLPPSLATSQDTVLLWTAII